MEIISNVALISINETLLVQLFCFIAFMFIMNRVMVRPLRGAKQDREDYIEKLGADISDAQKEMLDIAVQIESQEAEARVAALNIQKEIIARETRRPSGSWPPPRRRSWHCGKKPVPKSKPLWHSSEAPWKKRPEPLP